MRDSFLKKIISVLVIILILIIIFILIVMPYCVKEKEFGTQAEVPDIPVVPDAPEIPDSPDQPTKPTPPDNECNNNCDKEYPVDALLTMITRDDVNLYVDKDDVTKESVGDNEYINITSNNGKAMIALKSNKDLTRCTYNVKYSSQENSFENKYIMDNNQKGILKNQIILTLNGYKTTQLSTYSHVYDIDLNEIDNNSFEIKDIVIENDADNNSITEHNWNIILTFRNYRDYNQSNNAGKKIVGELKFEIGTCERIIER